MAFLSFGINARVYGGFGFFVVLGLALASFGASQLMSVKIDVGKLDALSAQTIRNIEAGRQIEIMRRTALRYKFDASEHALEAGSAAAAAASALLHRAAQEAFSDDRRRSYHSLSADISDFQRKRDQLVEITGRLNEAKAQMFAVGDDLTAASEKLTAVVEAGDNQSLIGEVEALDVRLLKVRVANWRFQATDDVKGPATFMANAEKAKGMIGRLEARDLSANERQSLFPVKDALSAYVAAFDKIAENLFKSNDLYSNEIIPRAIRMRDDVAGAEASQKKDFVETRLGVGKTIEDTIDAQMIIGLLTLVLSVFVANRIGRGIVRPISGMTAAMTRLSGGDVNTEIPSRDRVDEIGAMAKAVDVFKANLVNARQLEAEASQAAQLMQDALTRLRDAVEAVPEGFVLFDAEDRHVLWNARYAEIYSGNQCGLYQGMYFEDLVRSALAAGLYLEGQGKEKDYLRDRLEKHKTSENNFVQQLTDGRWLQVSERRTSDGGTIGVHVDITQLKQSKSTFRLLLASNPIPMIVYDRKTLAFLAVNAAAVEQYGYSQEQFLSMTLLDVFHRDDWDKLREAAATTDTASRRGLTWRHVLADGTEIDVATYARMLQYEGHDAAMVAVFDITERQRAEKRIAYLSRHDLLTDLPNRAEFNERLMLAIEGSGATRPPFAVICLNLDRFKQVNDVYGHAIGDEVLREAARRFATLTEGAFFARVGADEFSAIVTGAQVEDAAVESADALFAAMAPSFRIGELQINVGVSIGVAMFPNDGAAASVLANAHAALFRAKSTGGGTVCFFDAALDNSIRERHLLLQDLEHALERREFVLHYQPQAGKNGEIVGFEALLRWVHPTRGFVAPDAFIPIAEESGLIIQIGQWVLEEACREAASWPRPLNIAVNLSPIQFRRGDLPQTLHSILLETGLPANRLELEITEGALISDFSRATSILRRLKSLGARIAMDDFGTGYSSLSYLQAFPFDKIKIDRSFVSGQGSKRQSEAIIRAITGLGRGFGLPVIAEGVETEAQRIFLLNEGCEELQGYLIGRPQSINQYAYFVGKELPQKLSVG